MLNFLRNIGTLEIIIICLVIVLFFGGKKLNELARGLGESKKEFKKITKDLKSGKKKKGKDDEEEEETA